ncbi:MAG: formyltransferase family protein [Bacillota bacterium]
MRLVVITQDDPFYVPVFFSRFLGALDLKQYQVQAIYVMRPFRESPSELVRRMYRFYGPVDFVRRGVQYAVRLAGDRLRLRAHSVRAIAKRYGIPVLEVSDVNSPTFARQVAAYDPDVILSVAAPQLFGEHLLRLPNWGCLNVHSAKLPQYRGMMPVFWALYHGDRTVGVTVHRMDERLDRGDVLLQVEVPVCEGDSLDAVMTRCKEAAADAVLAALSQIRDGTVTLRPVEGRGSYFSFPRPEHVRVLRQRGYRLL